MVFKLVRSWFLIYLFLLIFFPSSVFAVSFSITSDKTSISEDDELDINIIINELTSCGKCYLEAAFTASLDNPRYLGFTKNNNGIWNKYVSSPAPDFIKDSFFMFEPVNSSWSGTLKAKIDTADGDYKGGGKYYAKVSRYTGNSSSGSWSNSLEINVVDNTFTTTPTLILMFSPTSLSTHTPTPTFVKTPTLTKKPTSTLTPTSKLSSVSSSVSPKVSITSITPTSVNLSPTEVKISTSSSKTLGLSTSLTPTKIMPKINKEVRILGMTKKTVSEILIALGIIFLLICVILFVRKNKLLKSDEFGEN